MSEWIKLKGEKLHFIKPYNRKRIDILAFVEDFKDYPLGTIKWCPRLKKYVFFADYDGIKEFLFGSSETLELKIMDKFIKKQMKKRKVRTPAFKYCKCKGDTFCFSDLIETDKELK